MKKILLSLVVIVLFTMNMNAQKQFAGIIKSKTDVEGENIDATIKAQFPVTSEMKVLNDKTRTDANYGGVGVTQITDMGNNKNYVIIDFSAMSMGIYYREVPTTNEKQSINYQYNRDDKKNILGFECYKVICTVTDLETDETQDIIMYISDDFLPDFKSSQFDGLKGFPLSSKVKVKTSDSEYFMVNEVIEIKASKKIKPVNFLLPSAAVPFSEMPAEIKAAFGLNEDED